MTTTARPRIQTWLPDLAWTREQWLRHILIGLVVLWLLEGIPPLARYFPVVEQIGIAHHIAGLSTYTPDGMFVLGEAPGLEGLLVATGCSGAGIAASGGIGLAVAQLAIGQTPAFDLAPHRVDRFGLVDPTDPVFRQRCADARSMKRSG